MVASAFTVAGASVFACVGTLLCIACQRCALCIACVDCEDCVGCIGCVGLRGQTFKVGARKRWR